MMHLEKSSRVFGAHFTNGEVSIQIVSSFSNRIFQL